MSESWYQFICLSEYCWKFIAETWTLEHEVSYKQQYKWTILLNFFLSLGSQSIDDDDGVNNNNNNNDNNNNNNNNNVYNRKRDSITYYKWMHDVSQK